MQRKAKRWKLLGQPSGHGNHRYFRDVRGRVSIADDSGTDPSFTDDGPLYLDPNRIAELRCDGDDCTVGSSVAIPVICGDDVGNDRELDEALEFGAEPPFDGHVVYVQPADFEWLVRNKLWKRHNVFVGSSRLSPRHISPTVRLCTVNKQMEQLKAEAKILRSLGTE
jgi:hypothetical protein